MKIFYSFVMIFACLGVLAAEEPMVHEAGGHHVIADLFECSSCDYSPDIEQVIADAATAAGATVLHVYVHKFSPQGMTGMVVLSESHIAFHTWPEHGYVACDVFTCGTTAIPEKAVEALIGFFKPKYSHIQAFDRGSNS